MVQDRRIALIADKDADAASDNHCFGMIDLDSIAIHEFHSEELKGPTMLECSQGVLKNLAFHEEA
jgi:hypothetical protein